MEKTLRKLKLIESLSITLPMDKNRFYDELKAITKEKPTSNIFSFPSLTANDKFVYIGKINHDNFEIKKKILLFDRNINFARATGTITALPYSIRIDAEIKKSNIEIFFSPILIVIGYTILIYYLLTSLEAGLFLTGIALLHGLLMLYIIYSMMKNDVKNLSYMLEREFYYFTKTQ